MLHTAWCDVALVFCNQSAGRSLSRCSSRNTQYTHPQHKPPPSRAHIIPHVRARYHLTDGGVLEPLGGPFAEVKMGPYSGPRGLNFHPSLRVAYVNCELSGTVVVCAINDKTGLQPLQSLSA